MASYINLGKLDRITFVPNRDGTGVIVADISEVKDERLLEIEFKEIAYLCVRLEDNYDKHQRN